MTQTITQTAQLPRGVSSLFSGKGHWRLARWGSLLPRIETFEAQFREMNDAELRKESLSLRYRVRCGESMEALLPEAFGLVREAGRRALNMRHFEVQLLGGMALYHGCIAEMETGEGKTLTATLPLYLHALAGKGAHLATVNDYLARRDAEWMTPIYSLLGLTVGVIETQMSQDERRKNYACDVTYGTAKEFGFDFLRDRLLLRRIRQQTADIFFGGDRNQGNEQPVQRAQHFCLVDEADSILIDEARTPLIISALPTEAAQEAVACYEWAAASVDYFDEDDDYEYDHEKRKVELTFAGRQKVRRLPHPEAMNSVGLIDLYEYIERAIKVRRDFQRDRDYVVRRGKDGKEEVVIVDESTGRLAEGRKWRDGIHQAAEAQEGAPVTVATGQAARITVQDLFLRYKHLAGMTGTIITSAGEIRKIYKRAVVKIPTNRACQRTRLPDRVFGSGEQKWEAIVQEVKEMHEQGRPVLIGTRSISKSEHLSRLLQREGIEHQVLNAHRIAEEAEIVARAGQPGKVTVATNMAGRGTDIKLGQSVPEQGGLHVICTELHDSARIDRQLVGRCARQGDPGTFRMFMAMDDDVLKTGFGPKDADRYTRQGERMSASEGLGRLFHRAQRKVESKHLRDRMILLYHEKQRKKVQLEMGQDPYLDSPD
ncbi:MAG: preprotein translocase subunit SecA [Planctomycetes bacterium]|nr:preprotein translocase subunit SecA [Planctomycetota bacterium]